MRLERKVSRRQIRIGVFAGRGTVKVARSLGASEWEKKRTVMCVEEPSWLSDSEYPFYPTPSPFPVFIHEDGRAQEGDLDKRQWVAARQRLAHAVVGLHAVPYSGQNTAYGHILTAGYGM
jgi:hypothetical protein